jgi:hypothetical protein
MIRSSIILALFLIANNLLAQKKSKNAWQSFVAIETGLPIVNTPYPYFKIPLNIEFERRKKYWGFGANIGLQYSRDSWGDCSERIVNTGRDLNNFINSYRPYCETLQYLNLKPSIFGSYYFLQKKKFNLFTRLGIMADVPILTHQRGAFYEINTQNMGGTSVQVINAGPIYINRNIPSFQAMRIGSLSNLGVNYGLNKRITLRFNLQSEWYSDYNGFLLLALIGVNVKI